MSLNRKIDGNYKILLIVFFILVSSGRIYAQEMWGIVSSNFAGSNGVIINPSSLTGSKLYMDVNILTADFYAGNNYLYIHSEDFKLFNFLKKDPEFPSYDPDNSAMDYYDNTSIKSGYVNVLLRGPSFFQQRGRHAIGLSTGVRVLASANRLPYDLANFGYLGLKYEPQHNINYNDHNFYGNTMEFAELGITYAYIVRQFSVDEFSVGITLKGLFGYSGGYVYADNLDYMVLNDSTANFRNLNAEVGFSIPVDYETNNFPDGSGLFRGNGVGADIGFTYQRKVRSFQKRKYDKLCRQRYIDYIYKVGVSLIDFGFVSFTKNTQLHAFENVSRYWVNIDTIAYSNMNQLMGELSDVFYGDPDASYRGDKMSVFLPAAVSIQLDYHIYRNWYINATAIHPIILGKSTIARPAQVVAVPRFETSRWEFSLPVALYEWKQLHFGIAARWEFLTIGSDNLGGLLGLQDFTGMDIYFSVKFNFRKGKCHGDNRFRPCYNQEYGIERK